MADVKAVDQLLQWPGELLDRVSALLAKVGIDLTPLVLQLFLLAIVVALLIPTVRRVRARRKADRLPLVAAVVLALVVLGVLLGLADNATTPKRVAGTLRSDRLDTAAVALLDYRDRVISTGAGAVDSVNGAFALHYDPLVDGRARKLRVTAAGCKPIEFELARAQLRARAEPTFTHRCAAD
ncbi:MAG: hypothetical protein AB1761_11405 [Pseudomonadota bacterium]